MFGRDRKEVMEDIYEAGGSELPYVGGGYNRRPRNLPASMNEIIKKMYELVFDLTRMADVEIPRAFPHTEPMVNYDPKYKHSSEERLNAIPTTVLKDADLAIEVCIKLKKLLTKARTILVDFFPSQLDHPNFRTEIANKFKYNIQVIDSFIQNIEKVLYHKKVGILHRKGQGISPTIDMYQLEKLRNHIIKIGYDKKTTNKDLVELCPSVLTMKRFSNQQPPSMQMNQSQNLHYGDSKNERMVLELSNRLLQSLNEEDD